MKEIGFESEGKSEKRGDSTPEEGDVMLRYVDLQVNVYTTFMSDAERKNFAQDIIELIKLLNEGNGMSAAFCEDMLNQVHRVEEGYLRLQRAVEAVHELERESRGGVQAPHVYEKAVKFIQAALDVGVPTRALQPLEKTIREYVHKVRLQSM